MKCVRGLVERVELVNMTWIADNFVPLSWLLLIALCFCLWNLYRNSQKVIAWYQERNKSLEKQLELMRTITFPEKVQQKKW